MLAEGQRVDRYTVEAIIGTGGTAVVYQVRHTTLGTRHALKVLSITSAAIRERMMREGRVQAALRHLNVVLVSDIIDVDGSPGLLMEFIDGPSLDAALGAYKLDVVGAETLFRGILSGVRAIHSAGLVHRDLKPANVLLYRSPKGFVPKVTDFGLAKVLQGDEMSIGHTRSGIAMGTPSYMAPEQVRDARGVDQRADIFSLGCILYELMTGHRTFPGDQALRIYNLVTEGEFVHPRDHAPDLPDRIVTAIVGALEVDREARIPDCDTLLRVLRGEMPWGSSTARPKAQDPKKPAESPTKIPEDAPSLSVAARGPGGMTPGPPPMRGSGPPGLGVQAAVSQAPEAAKRGSTVPSDVPAPIDGTLGGDEPLEAPVAVGWWSGVAWAIGILLVLLLVGGFVLAIGATATAIVLETYSRAPAEVSDAPRLPTPEILGDTETETETETETDPALAPAVDPVASAPAGELPVSTPPAAPVAPVVAPRPAVTAPRPVKPAPPAAVPVEVKLLSRPFGASIRVDGKDVAKRTNNKVALAPGRHTIELRSGEDQVRFTVDVRPGVAGQAWCYAFDEGRAQSGGCP